jgi:putative flippase GtrA
MYAIVNFFKQNIISFMQFGLVGLSGLVIDFSITLLLRDVLQINEYFASGCGFVVAAASNYYLNSRWTFKGNAPATAPRFLIFFIISLVGLILHVLLLQLFIRSQLSFYLAKALAVGCVFIWNFTANRLITFRTLIVFVLFNACKQGNADQHAAQYEVKVDSTWGLGNKVRFIDLPGRIVAYNPDSANKLIIVGGNGKIINTIYKSTGSNEQPQSLNHIATDSATMEVYVYSPLQHAVFVYDAEGNYKKRVFIEGTHYGSFNRMNGRFIFLDTSDTVNKENNKMYIVDSTGRYEKNW